MDRNLVERAMAGEREAFNELARASLSRLFGVATLILRDRDQASDATQEALIAAWRDLSALRDPDRFDAWLYRLTVRACYREASRTRRRQVVEIRELNGGDRVAADQSPALFARDELERGFRRLGIQERAVLVLHHVEDLPLTEIADLLGVPVGTVKSRLHRARQTMRAALDADARPGPIQQERTA